MSVKAAKIYWEVKNIDRRIGEMIQQLEASGFNARKAHGPVDKGAG
jgi:hypothetical protein